MRFAFNTALFGKQRDTLAQPHRWLLAAAPAASFHRRWYLTNKQPGLHQPKAGLRTCWTRLPPERRVVQRCKKTLDARLVLQTGTIKAPGNGLDSASSSFGFWLYKYVFVSL
jgi:hypothetical protein